MVGQLAAHPGRSDQDSGHHEDGYEAHSGPTRPGSAGARLPTAVSAGCTPSSSGRSRTGGHITACRTSLFSHGRSRRSAGVAPVLTTRFSMLSSGISKSAGAKQLEERAADVEERYAAAERARSQDPEVKERRAAYSSVSVYASQIVASASIQCNFFTASYDTLA